MLYEVITRAAQQVKRFAVALKLRLPLLEQVVEGGLAHHDGVQVSTVDRRITSYNVCYTKLLRVRCYYRIRFRNMAGQSTSLGNGTKLAKVVYATSEIS